MAGNQTTNSWWPLCAFGGAGLVLWAVIAVAYVEGEVHVRDHTVVLAHNRADDIFVFYGRCADDGNKVTYCASEDDDGN